MTDDRLVSFILPSRTNLRYLKLAYNSIRKHLGYRHPICMADDASTDNSWAWMQNIMEKDINVKALRNNSGTRWGHCIWYDKIIEELVDTDIFIIWHADMVVGPHMISNMLKHLTDKKVIVSATRIEPPLHPPQPCKIIKDFGIEPEEFNQLEFDKYVRELQDINKDKTTEGIFAPWTCYKSTFQEINGHDPLYKPQSKEDSDEFSRFQLHGCRFIQSWDALAYHMTCRGSRFANGAQRNPDGKVFMKGRETKEWLIQNRKSERNFVRKWGTSVKHDSYMKPIIPHKYNIAFIVKNSNEQLIELLEPHCSVLYVDINYRNYIKDEQPNTLYDLKWRLRPSACDKYEDITVEFDGSKLTQNSYNIIQTLSDIITDSGVVGETMELDIFKLTINSMKTYEHELIVADKSGKLR